MNAETKCSSEGASTGSELPCSGMTIRGRAFTRAELRFIQYAVSDQYDNGRTVISRFICEELDWRQPNGWLKDRACRDVLRELDELGLISLPPPKLSKESKTCRSKSRTSRAPKNLGPIVNRLAEDLRLEFAKGSKLEQVWNELVENYHYLGHKIVVGRCIKYLVIADSNLVGAISFSSPAWQLASRDTLLPQLGIELSSIHDVTINNSRFLILPNVQVPNLASRVLALATKKIVADWTDYYSVEPLIAETFVESDKFLGTCYRAANWIRVGNTKGFAKRGASYRNGQTFKHIFLYGLNKNIRRKLSLLRDSL